MFSLFGDHITEFLQARNRAVIATVDEEGQPSTSTIFYILTKRHELYFMTKSQTAKYKNIKKNYKVALTVVDNEKPQAVNVNGVAAEMVETSERDEILKQLIKLSYESLHDYAPIIKLHRGGFAVFKIVPHKAVFTDFTPPMGKVVEETKDFKS